MADSPETFGMHEQIGWFGIVEDIKDPVEMGRIKVRIHHFHAQDYKLLPTDKLPWAIQLMPVISASHGGTGISPTGLQVGSWVYGIFLDGRRGQFPMVMGTIHGIHATQNIPSDPGGSGVDSGLGPSGAVNDSGSGGSGGGGGGGGGNPASVASPTNIGNGLPSGGYTNAGRVYPGSTVIGPNHPMITGGAAYGNGQSISPGLRTGLFGAGLDGSRGHASQRYNASSIYAADAVFRYAASQGVQMRVAHGGGANGHSPNHGANGVTGQAIDIKPTGGWKNNAQVKDYAKVASGAGADRLGIPSAINGSGLHVQDSLGTKKRTSWGYGQNAPADIASGHKNNTYGGYGQSANPPQVGEPGAGGAESGTITPEQAEEGRNPMNKYTSEEVSPPPTSKSPDNASGITKQDMLEGEKDSTRSDPFTTGGDGSAFGEPCPPDVGTYPNVQTWQAPSGSKIEMDSTAGGERVQMFHAGSQSYMEIDNRGNMVNKARGDFIALSENNGRVGARGEMMMSAQEGGMRMYAKGNMDMQSKGGMSFNADGGLNFGATGSGVLRYTGDLVIEAGSIKLMAVGGSIDMRAGSEVNMEAGGNMNMQSGGEMAMEAKGNMAQVTYGDWNAKASGKANLGSGGDSSIKAGGAIKQTAGGDFNAKGSNVKLEGGVIHLKGTARADLYESPNVPQMPIPSGVGTAPSGAAEADDPQTGLTAKANGNKETGRNSGSAGGGVASQSNANKIDPDRDPASNNQTGSEATKKPKPRPCYKDPNQQVDDSAPSNNNNFGSGQ